MSEVRVHAEGSVWWVQASGTGNAWATASAPASGFVGYCDGFAFSSGQKTVQIKDRGRPNHHKITEWDPIDPKFNFLFTGTYPYPASGSGATVPMHHLEFRASAAEIAAASAYYYQFYGCVLEKQDFKENKDGDQVTYNYKALAMNGPTASGYIK